MKGCQSSGLGRRDERTFASVGCGAWRPPQLGQCPQCREPVRGSELLVSGHCSNCDKALTSLLVPTRYAELVQNEYLALLGAVGVLVGLALATAGDGRD